MPLLVRIWKGNGSENNRIEECPHRWATGIVGLNLANRLQEGGDWTIHGLARNPNLPQGIEPLAADLLDAQSVCHAVLDLMSTHFRLNLMARTLVTGRSSMASLVVPDLLHQTLSSQEALDRRR